jgi:hypothetical protein
MDEDRARDDVVRELAEVVHEARGEAARQLKPQHEAEIARFSKRGPTFAGCLSSKRFASEADALERDSAPTLVPGLLGVRARAGRWWARAVASVRRFDRPALIDLY